jgi:hypothetical protein
MAVALPKELDELYLGARSMTQSAVHEPPSEGSISTW